MSEDWPEKSAQEQGKQEEREEQDGLELIPPPRAPRRPASREEPGKKKRRGQPPPKAMGKGLSAESRWIGFLVLGFGALLFLAVAMIALWKGGIPATTQSEQGDIAGQVAQKTQGGNATSPTGAQEAEQGEGLGNPDAIPDARALAQSLHKMTADPRADRYKGKGVEIKRDIDFRDIEGVWEARLKRGTAVVEFRDGAYRIIIADDDPLALRYYSNGALEIREKGLSLFSPDESVGPPQDQFSYTPLSLSRFPVIVQRQGDYMIWEKPGPGSEIVGSMHHPFLRLVDDNLAIWQKL